MSRAQSVIRSTFTAPSSSQVNDSTKKILNADTDVESLQLVETVQEQLTLRSEFMEEFKASVEIAVPIPESSDECDASKQPHIKQPIVKLDRLSAEDQLLMQQSLSKFAESKPKLAKELGIVPAMNEENNASGSDDDTPTPKRKRERKSNDNESDDDEYVPDTFSALVGSNKRRKVSNKEEKSEPIVAKPKLRRVEKKFVPVLEKLSTEELMETNTYLKFNRSIEHVLKSAEDVDISEIGI